MADKGQVPKSLQAVLFCSVLALCAYAVRSTSSSAAATATGLEARVRALEDERAILNTMYTYAHALDYGGEEAFKSIWTEDADWGGGGQRKGIAKIMQAFREHPHAPQTHWKHMLVEPQISLNGDHATAESYLSRFFDSPSGPVVASMGRYLDEFVRGPDGKWRFKVRRIERDACIPLCGGLHNELKM